MPTTKPKRTLALPLVALALFLPVLAACGRSEGSSGVSSPAADGGTAGKSNDQYLKYAQCMRKNGVPNWPDPVDGDKFRMRATSGPGSVDPKSPQFKAASQKCQSVAPPGWAPRSRQDPDMQAKMLKYARCMRENGLPKLPDPQGGVLDPGAVDINSPQFKAADHKCQSLRPVGAGG